MVMIREPRLGVNKPVEILTSNKNMRRTLAYQLDQAKAEDLADLEPVEQLQASMELIGKTEKYIQQMLKLSDEQYKLLEDLPLAESTEIATRVALRLQGLKDSEIDKIFDDGDEEETEEDGTVKK